MDRSLKQKKYILYEYNYDDTIGGTIVMHKLCDLLNHYGYEAYMWQSELEKGFKTNQYLKTPIINIDNLDDYIVVYNDTINGNPLRAPNVVRWFTTAVEIININLKYGSNELYFYHGFPNEVVIKELKVKADNSLTIYHFNTEYYQQTNFKERLGSCYSIRKYRNRTPVHNLENSIKIDALSHKETAKVFNRCKYFYSYDVRSINTIFAAMFGCIPVVIPLKGLSVEEWRHPKEIYKHGVAYGESEIDYAINNKNKIYEYMDNMGILSKNDTKSFIEKTHNFFSKISKTEEMIESEKLSYIDKIKNIDNKVSIVIFGAHEGSKATIDTFSSHGISFKYICDNDIDKIGVYKFSHLVFDPEKLFRKKEDFIVLLTNTHKQNILKQLSKFNNIKSVYSIYDN